MSNSVDAITDIDIIRNIFYMYYGISIEQHIAHEINENYLNILSMELITTDTLIQPEKFDIYLNTALVIKFEIPSRNIIMITSNYEDKSMQLMQKKTCIENLSFSLNKLNMIKQIRCDEQIACKSLDKIIEMYDLPLGQFTVGGKYEISICK